MAIKTAEAHLYNGIHCLLVDVIGYGSVAINSTLICDGWRMRYGTSDVESTTDIALTDERYATYGLGGRWTSTSAVTCDFPTWVRFDMEAFWMPEGRDVIVQMEEGFVKEGDYAESNFNPLPRIENFFTYRTPWRGVSRNNVLSASLSNTPYRIRPLSANLTNTMGFVVRGNYSPTDGVQLISSSGFMTSSPVKTTDVLSPMYSAFGPTNVGGMPVLSTITRVREGDPISLTDDSSSISVGNFRARIAESNLNSEITTSVDNYRIREANIDITSLFDANIDYIQIVDFEANLSAELNVSSEAEVVINGAATITSSASLTSTPNIPMVDYLPNVNGSISFQVYGPASISIDWGDGTSEDVTVATGVTGNIYHGYTTAATRTITTRGTAYGLGWLQVNNLVGGERRSIGDLNPVKLTNYLKVTNWASVPVRIPTSVTSLEGLCNAGNLSNLQYWDTSNVTNMKLAFNSISSSNSSNLNAIESWNTSNVTDMSQMFSSSSYSATPDLTSWDTSKVTDMSFMFYQSSIKPNISTWDVSSVTNMESMLYGNNPTSDITAWDVSSVTNMKNMLGNNTTFNQNIGSWNVSSVTTMESMFQNATAFNQDISSWNVSNVQSFRFMFAQASSFNQNINGWNTSNATSMYGMFYYNTGFNQPIGNWNVSNVTDFSRMFNGATAFNQSLNTWSIKTTSSVLMLEMFRGASAFNQPLNSWNISAVTNVTSMFEGASSFNSSLSNWSFASCNSINSMFQNATAFNQDLSSWDVSNVQYFDSAFRLAPSYNQPLNSWNMSAAISTQYMFDGATAFNQPLNSWNLSNVTSMIAMFQDTQAFNQSITGWNVSKVVSFAAMFRGASAFNQDLGSLNWNPNLANLNFSEMFKNSSLHSSGMSTENLDRTLIGWANKVSANSGIPTQRYLGLPTGYVATSTVYGGTPYDNGAAALTYLDVTRQWNVSYG